MTKTELLSILKDELNFTLEVETGHFDSSNNDGQIRVRLKLDDEILAEDYCDLPDSA